MAKLSTMAIHLQRLLTFGDLRQQAIKALHCRVCRNASTSLHARGAPAGDLPEDDVLEWVTRTAVEPLRLAKKKHRCAY